MDTYHGTSETNAAVIAAGKVDSTLGGGELGRGFYTGEHLYEAKAWAFHQSGDKRKNVVLFSTPDNKIELLSIKILDICSASLMRYKIRSKNQTRTFRFNLDFIWAPIVGSERASGDQYKWESSKAEALLNHLKTIRSIL